MALCEGKKIVAFSSIVFPSTSRRSKIFFLYQFHFLGSPRSHITLIKHMKICHFCISTHNSQLCCSSFSFICTLKRKPNRLLMICRIPSDPSNHSLILVRGTPQGCPGDDNIAGWGIECWEVFRKTSTTYLVTPQHRREVKVMDVVTILKLK